MKYRTLKFDCGCEVTLDPSIPITYWADTQQDCPLTWKMICDGDTKGIFQIESGLGKTWSKKVLPSDIESLSAVIALIRPGCLKAMIGDKSMTQHYADRKNFREPVTNIHDSIAGVLSETFQIIVYQEQILQIAKIVAKFDLKEADELRRGIGKKKAEVLAKMRELFVSKSVEAQIIQKDEAVNLFDLIEASNRYSFNKSHSISYATQSYQAAFIKAHFPLFFYESWLRHAEDKNSSRFEEMYELVEDAKLHNIIVRAPDLRFSKDNFELNFEKNSVYFGLGNIKGLGSSKLAKTRLAIMKGEAFLGKPVANWTWYDFLVGVSDDIGAIELKGLISSGALDYMGVPRKKMTYELQHWKVLTDKEKSCATITMNAFSSLIEIVQFILDKDCTHSDKRREKVEAMYKSLTNPPMKLVDSASDTMRAEMELLGVPLSRASVDDYNKNMVTCSCKEIHDGNYPKHILMGVEIKSIKEHNAKNNSKMAFLTVTDGTAIINNVTVFSQEYEKFKEYITEQNMVYIHAIPSQNGYKSIIVKKIEEMNLTEAPF